MELVCAVFGCLYAGCVPIPVKAPPQGVTASCQSVEVDLELVRQISVSSGAAAMLTHMPLVKLLKTKV